MLLQVSLYYRQGEEGGGGGSHSLVMSSVACPESAQAMKYTSELGPTAGGVSMEYSGDICSFCSHCTRNQSAKNNGNGRRSPE